jgi:hypothetical protein
MQAISREDRISNLLAHVACEQEAFLVSATPNATGLAALSSACDKIADSMLTAFEATLFPKAA